MFKLLLMTGVSRAGVWWTEMWDEHLY